MEIKQGFSILLFMLGMLFLAASLYFSGRLVYSMSTIDKLSKQLTASISTDKEKILTCLKYVANIKTTCIANRDFGKSKMGDPFKKIWAAFYSLPPANLIPPDIVLNYKLAYKGPCGAKSKLLIAILKSLNYECWQLNQRDHSLVELNVNGILTPIDPTYNLYFTDNGNFLKTETVTGNKSILVSNIQKLNIEYPVNNKGYLYDDLKRIKLFFYLQPYYLFIFFSLLSSALLTCASAKLSIYNCF